ncbi:MJ1255/VC2487 family glycosyltransferase [Glaciecola sp. 1036]|uniref:MJ1255/VC2487 family glycosyltransferase n=1 Tax=Alteromonadaceae TaxID=72275 RepID=UPI003CFD4B10
MRILYGIQGTGNGHITRARHMAKGFDERDDVVVDYFFSGRQQNGYFDMQVFGDYQMGRGLTFVTQNGKIHYSKTLTQNNLFTLIKEIKTMMVNDYDLVVNDFEPITAWAAKLAGIPSMSVSHQAAFMHQVPKHKQGLLDKVITNYFAPTSHCLGTHWYHFGYDIIPPFVSADLCTHQTTNALDNTLLVYLPFENTQLVREQLHILSEYSFNCYHPEIKQPEQDRNINWQPLSSENFKRDLKKSSGVISNCGFELSTECLSLGKPLLVKPLDRQYEQLSNAYTLKEIGASQVIHSLEAENIDEWLQQREGVRIQYPTNCRLLIDWIANGNWQDKKEICSTLWQQVTFPLPMKRKLEGI